MIALGSDHAGLPLKKVIMAYLDELKIEYKDYGTYSDESVHYPEFGVRAAKAVASGECERGIVFCGTGIGIGISANKVKGIRCATCSEPYSAKMSREHNDANMLSLGARVVGDDLAKMIVDAWLNANFLNGRHEIRVNQLKELDQ
jgi:ribose 5-phosphate isomerase B